MRPGLLFGFFFFLAFFFTLFAFGVGFFLQTDDFWRDHARMTAAGVEFLETPREEPYATVVVFRDAYGNRWDLLQPKG